MAKAGRIRARVALSRSGRECLPKKRCADNGLAGLARHCLYLAFTPFHLHSRKTGGSASERQSPMRGSLPSRRSMKIADPCRRPRRGEGRPGDTDNREQPSPPHREISRETVAIVRCRSSPSGTQWGSRRGSDQRPQPENNAYSICYAVPLDAPRGFEPRLTESESVVLPLDDRAMPAPRR